MYNKSHLFNEAIKITKEYSRGGGQHPDSKLRDIYETLKELNSDLEGEEPGPLVG